MKSAVSYNAPLFILAGPPNSGKTTLFNWLTGYKARVVNYPGSTVDYSKGKLLKKYQNSGEPAPSIIDTPGIYSLFAKNPSEELTEKILFQFPRSVVVVVIDILRIRRQLPLVLQLKESGFSIVVALTMADLVSAEEKAHLSRLSKELNAPVCPIEGKLGKGVSEIVQMLKNKTFSTSSLKRPGARLSRLQPSFFKQTDHILKKVFPKGIHEKKYSQFLDRILLHPVWGVFSFTAIMTGLFSSIFWLAAPLMDAVDLFFSFLAEKILLLGPSLLTDFLANGVVTSFAAVFVFVPQIFILFAGICILEDSGYLARSAGLADALFSKIGLSGRSFVPFLSGYACAIPACLSARNITSRIERLIVIAVIPILTCSARLPVYSLLLSLVFYGESSWKPGIWMTLIYIGSMLLAVLAAGILNKCISVKEAASPFVMELPTYRRPLIFGVLSSAWRRTSHYIKEAGPLIFIFALIIWGASHFPRNLDLTESQQIEQSYAGRFGKTIEPAFEWMGGDWRVGVSLLSAFVAREVFVSTLASLFQITQSAEEETIKRSLLKKMGKAQNRRGDPVFTPLSLVVLILFFMISLQCLSTTAVVKKETNSTLFAASQLIILNALAYILCTGVYQLGRVWGF